MFCSGESNMEREKFLPVRKFFCMVCCTSENEHFETTEDNQRPKSKTTTDPKSVFVKFCKQLLFLKKLEIQQCFSLCRNCSSQMNSLLYSKDSIKIVENRVRSLQLSILNELKELLTHLNIFENQLKEFKDSVRNAESCDLNSFTEYVGASSSLVSQSQKPKNDVLIFREKILKVSLDITTFRNDITSKLIYDFPETEIKDEPNSDGSIFQHDDYLPFDDNNHNSSDTAKSTEAAMYCNTTISSDEDNDGPSKFKNFSRSTGQGFSHAPPATSSDICSVASQQSAILPPVKSKIRRKRSISKKFISSSDDDYYPDCDDGRQDKSVTKYKKRSNKLEVAKTKAANVQTEKRKTKAEQIRIDDAIRKKILEEAEAKEFSRLEKSLPETNYGRGRRKSSLKSISKIKRFFEASNDESSITKASENREASLDTSNSQAYNNDIFSIPTVDINDEIENETDEEYEPDSDEERRANTVDQDFFDDELVERRLPVFNQSYHEGDEVVSLDQKKGTYISIPGPLLKVNLKNKAMSQFRKSILTMLLSKKGWVPKGDKHENSSLNLQNTVNESESFNFDYIPPTDMNSDEFGTVHMNGIGIEIDEASKAIKCTACSYILKLQSKRRRPKRIRQQLQRHILRHFGKIEYSRRYNNVSCKICGKPSDSVKAVIKHAWTHKSEEERAEAEAKGKKNPLKELMKMQRCQCPVCGIILSSKKCLNGHMESRHTEDRDRERKLCETCGKSVLMSTWKVHKTRFCRKQSLGEAKKEWKCVMCDKTFLDQQYLRNHLKRLHSDAAKERPYLCDICSHSFKTLGDLRIHLKIHGPKRFQCDICGKAFALNKNLKRHTCISEGKKKKRSSTTMEQGIGGGSFTCEDVDVTGENMVFVHDLINRN